MNQLTKLKKAEMAIFLGQTSSYNITKHGYKILTPLNPFI